MEATSNNGAMVYLCIFRHQDDKKQVLLQRRWQDNRFDLVAGGRAHDGESLMQALIRIAEEQIGIAILAEDLDFLTFVDGYNTGYHKGFFRVKDFSGEPRIIDPNQCAEHVWADLDNLPAHIMPYLPAVFRNIELGIYYDDATFSVQQRRLAETRQTRKSLDIG